ncbi:MAG: phosphomannomutase [Deltaproteobacteria bacterium GWA2_38_16]|nr:MAG: phosphomannomutase [Deltaproteobacteria bacterium GWA2_38_16]OGQ01782.1 MAG: phosphomannomutase [Deltaproteobacteria bacterium RIFCSPHIGHO2_02_FULL_38_15]OGQ30238.1 MAG: phosphomannomutase [Deltaproteobacteria bacterium RIFCSPLOWO2_01_FULL_38_9]HBQ21410.1 phosphomannomutase [Deltaproteobacteria bacterium]
MTSQTVNPLIFREYDIRGLADCDFSDSFAEDLGKALGTLLHEKNESHMAVGRDCRLTSEKYAKALIRGILSTGTHVIDLGICPTPLMYFSVFDQEFDHGVSITGSHNPAEYNGFKICLNRNSLYGHQIQDLKDRIQKKIFYKSSKKGNISLFNIMDVYAQFILKNFSLKKSLKIVVDAGNGVAGPIAPHLFKKLGCNVTELFCTMDGRFPNHFPDPTVIENLSSLIATVKERGADLGIAFDGDADRIGVVDNEGSILWGDKLLILYARQILKQHPGAPIIGEVKCTHQLFSEIKKNGGRPIMWKTGHSLIKSKIKEEKALLAGEMSGHMFFADRYYGFDDAIYAACRLLEILSNSKESLSHLLGTLPKTFSTPEIRIPCSDEKKFLVVEKAKHYFKSRYDTIDIDGVRVEFSDGWGLIRASNTQPVLVLRFEASSQKRLEAIQKLIETTLQAISQ